MFRKKKPETESGQPVLRGRSSAPQGRGADSAGSANPLARRLQFGAEPPTIDLSGPATFPESQQAGAEPQTSALQAAPASLERFISSDPKTGKLYLHPGSGQYPVLLCGSAISAPTELRPGDEIRLGGATFRFLSSA